MEKKFLKAVLMVGMTLIFLTSVMTAHGSLQTDEVANLLEHGLGPELDVLALTNIRSPRSPHLVRRNSARVVHASRDGVSNTKSVVANWHTNSAKKL